MNMQSGVSNDLLGQGRRALKDGRFDVAIEAFNAAWHRNMDAQPTREGLFLALRQLSIVRGLVDRYLEDMGWEEDSFDGFAEIGPVQHRGSLIERQRQLRDGRYAGKDLDRKLTLILQADLLAYEQRIEKDWVPGEKKDDEGQPGPSGDATAQKHDKELPDPEAVFRARMSYIVGRAALIDGRAEEAVDHLNRALSDDVPYAGVYRELGRAYMAAGDGLTALYNFNIAQIFYTETWFDQWAPLVSGAVRTLGRYKTYTIIFADNRFYATPNTPGIFETIEGQNVHYRVPLALPFRIWLRRVLPEPVMAFLRSIVVSTPLMRFTYSRRISSRHQ